MKMEGHLKINILQEEQLEGAVKVIMLAFNCSEDTPLKDLSTSFTEYPYKPQSLIGTLEGKIIATIQCTPAYFHKNCFSISWVAVTPSFQGQGIGKAMIQYAENYICSALPEGEAGTIILTDGTKGNNNDFYNKLGYKILGPNHSDQPFMSKIINIMVL